MRNLIPPLPARAPDEKHRTSTQLELFFDLISVIAIASVTAGLHHAISAGHGLQALPRFGFMFMALWWCWMNFTWFASAFDNDGPVYRVLVGVIMLGELIFAGGAGRIFETLDFSWGILGWCIMRLGMAALWLRAASNPDYRATGRRYAAGITIAQLLWVLIYLTMTPGTGAMMLAGLAVFLVELAVPVNAERARRTPFHRHHMIERYGLLTIISLGEIMLSISRGFGQLYGEAEGAADHGAAAAMTSVSSFLMVLSLFWIYFAPQDHLKNRRFATALVWGYLHVFIFGGIAALGAGIAAEIDLAGHHGRAAAGQIAWWLGTPLAVVFAALWIVRDRHHDLGMRGAALPVMAAVAIAGAAMGMATWGFALVALAALIWRAPFRQPGPVSGDQRLGPA